MYTQRDRTGQERRDDRQLHSSRIQSETLTDSFFILFHSFSALLDGLLRVMESLVRFVVWHKVVIPPSCPSSLFFAFASFVVKNEKKGKQEERKKKELFFFFLLLAEPSVLCLTCSASSINRGRTIAWLSLTYQWPAQPPSLQSFSRSFSLSLSRL